MSRTTTSSIWARLHCADLLRENPPRITALKADCLVALKMTATLPDAPLGTAGAALKLRRYPLRHVADLAQTAYSLSWTCAHPDRASSKADQDAKSKSTHAAPAGRGAQDS
jgi:hypothetical protein